LGGTKDRKVPKSSRRRGRGPERLEGSMNYKTRIRGICKTGFGFQGHKTREEGAKVEKGEKGVKDAQNKNYAWKTEKIGGQKRDHRAAVRTQNKGNSVEVDREEFWGKNNDWGSTHQSVVPSSC